jgi:hypothetical protein
MTYLVWWQEATTCSWNVWLCLVTSQCDTEREMNKWRLKTNKTPVNELTHGTRINPWIPATPRYRYAVCCGVPKCNTVPVPVIPVLEEPRVYPYPCGTLRIIVVVDEIQARTCSGRGGRHHQQNHCIVLYSASVCDMMESF